MKDNLPEFPPLDPALIRALDARFPERSPVKGETHDDLMYRGGQRNVVRFLAEILKRQTELET